mmetsp:Transcript_84226/g.146260  ORF Transcript_84226/g.146260 Transcript_84226/m.146260 type:complete len:313 (-) Transcript_84226:289-1227(-)
MARQCSVFVILSYLCLFCLARESCTQDGCYDTQDIVELLQTSHHLHSRGQTSLSTEDLLSTWHQHGAPGDVPGVTKGWDPVAGQMVEVDPSTGQPCDTCGNPQPERIAPGVDYKHRTDCGSARNKPGARDVPLITYSKPATADRPATNAWCELNMQKICADSVYNKDFLYQAKVIQRTANATFDPWFCYHNGWLDPKLRSLAHDYDKMDEWQKNMCHSQKYLKYGWNTTMTANEMDKVLSQGLSRTPNYPTPEESTFLGAWTCAMGNAGCDIAYCAYSFCILKYEFGGTPVIGMYDECEGWDPVKGMPIPSE